jgi:hypothetical protein
MMSLILLVWAVPGGDYAMSEDPTIETLGAASNLSGG